MEINHESVYVRWGFVKSIVPATETEPERIIWTYNEYFMAQNEYYDVCSGRYGGTYDDVLRSLQRKTLYDEADERIMKYTTDVPDEVKKQNWITFKAAVRATQKAAGYPEKVTYPEMPE